MRRHECARGSALKSLAEPPTESCTEPLTEPLSESVGQSLVRQAATRFAAPGPAALARAVALSLAMSLLVARPARAETPGASDFARGMELYRGGDCADAVRPLEAATRAGTWPGGLIALGYCYRQLKLFPKATDAYQRYLQLHADDEKRVVALLEETLGEEREWRGQQPDEDAPPPPARAQSPALGSPQPGTLPAPPAPPALGGVLLDLHVDKKSARVQQLRTVFTSNMQGEFWSDVCGAPCSVPVEGSALLRIGGEGVQPSSSFSLPPGVATARIDVKVADRDRRAAAAVLGVGGGLLTLSGLGMVIGGASMQPSASICSNAFFADSCSSQRSTASTIQTVGVVVLVLGGVGLISGLAMAGHTSTEVTVGR